MNDRGLYAPGQYWLERKDIIGRVRGYLPYLGIFTLIMNDYPLFKYIMLGLLCFYALTHREE